MQKELLKISLSLALIGTLFLLFLSNIEPRLTLISELNETKLNSIVKIQGKITNNKEINPDFYILTIQDETNKIEAVLNKKFQSNKTLEIIGKLDKYKDKLQIQAEKIAEIEK